MSDLAPIHAANATITAAEAHVKVARDKLADDIHVRAAAEQTIADIDAGEDAATLSALEAGLSPPETARADAKRRDEARRTLKSMPTLIGQDQSNLQRATNALERAHAAKRGAVWSYLCGTDGKQGEAAHAAKVAGDAMRKALIDLCAIDLVREHYSAGGQPLHIAFAGDEPPWSGRQIVRNLIAAFPDKLKPESLNFEDILKAALPAADRIIAAIEQE